MFEYLDYFSALIIKKLASFELYRLSEGHEDDYPLISRYATMVEFWLDLTEYHFGIRPDREIATSLQDAKKIFQAKYLELAPLVFFKRIQQLITEGQFNHALEASKEAIEDYDFLGRLFYIWVCQQGFTNAPTESDKKDFANQGLDQLSQMAKIDTSSNSPLTFFHKSNWKTNIVEAHGGIPEFIQHGQSFFNQI